ncbi:MAG: plasma-membrane proton-efflux P-type ATPase, partial [Chloroflexota bacterium]
MSAQVDSVQLEKASSQDALDQLSVDPEKGLSREEAQQRLQGYGQNVIEEKAKNPLLKFFSHFWGPIPWMIEAAVILSAVAQRWEDFGVIFTMLLINGGVSFWHENKASNAIEALKERLALQARVIREGESQTIEAKNLVPGDILSLRMGDIVPADAKLLADQHLSVDESALTGESLPVDKEDGDVVYSSTTAKRGQAKAVVTATGRNTKFARTVELVERAEEVSHFRRAVLRIGYFLIGTTAVLAVIIISVSVVRGDPLVQVLLFALALTLAGIPQALPAVLSVTMTVGANRLARWKAIVSRLASMEEIAGLQVLCADKTGTLTKNELELQQAVLVDADREHDVILAAALTVERDTDDPIDRAVLAGLEDLGELDRYQVVNFNSFDPTRKRAEADVKRDMSQFSVAKGAPQAVLQLVDADDELLQKVNAEVDRLGEEGYRSLGVARKDNGKWRYLGILPLLDPPRDDSAEVVREAHRRGVDVRMVTGDHSAIGRQVANLIDLGQNIKKASELFPEGEEEAGTRARQEPQLSEELLAADGFSEVTPEHKFNLIRAF